MFKRLASPRANKPRKATFVPRALLACVGAGAGAGVIPVCVPGMVGCFSSTAVLPAFNDYVDTTPDASDGGMSHDAALPDAAAPDILSPEPPDAELDGAEDASGVDP